MFENLFLLPKDIIIISKPLKSLNLLKALKLKASVNILILIIIILKYNKEGDIILRIRDIREIKSSRGRTIRLIDKGLPIRKKNK
jgi:hypothetical protein